MNRLHSFFLKYCGVFSWLCFAAITVALYLEDNTWIYIGVLFTWLLVDFRVLSLSKQLKALKASGASDVAVESNTQTDTVLAVQFWHPEQ